MENRRVSLSGRNPFVRSASSDERALLGEDWSDGSSEEDVPYSTRQRAYLSQRRGQYSEYFNAGAYGIPSTEGVETGQEEVLGVHLTKKCHVVPAEKEIDAAPCSSASPFKEVTVQVTGQPQEAELLLVNGPIKKAQPVQPWMVGNVYSWPVGALFDHIEGASEEEWMDEGCSSDEDMDSETEEDKRKGKKKAVDDILVEMGLPKVARTRTRRPAPALPRLESLTSSDEPDAALGINEVIKLRIEDIVFNAVMKYVA